MRALIFFFPLVAFASEQAQSTVSVFVSIVPQKFFVEQIGGDLVKTSVMVKPGQSPAMYEPTPKQISELSKAHAYFRIGVDFERVWLPRMKVANPLMKVVDTRQGIRLRNIEEVNFSFLDRRDDHEHSRKDPHIWTSPPLVKIQGRTIRDALIELDPEHRAEYEENYRRLSERLDQLDREIRRILHSLERRSFMVFHPSWGYYADTFDLRQIPIEIEGKEPGAKQLVELVGWAREQRISVIFVQQQFSNQMAKAVADAIGARVVTVDPLAEEYMENLLQVTRSFAHAMESP